MRCGIDEYVDKLTKELSKRGSSPTATTLLKQINKIDKRTVDINGVKIEYYSVSDGGIQNLAVNTSEGIFIQKDITATKAIEYLNQESVDHKLQNVLEVKKQADDKLYTEYNVRLEDLLNTMDNNQIRKFLLLHEHRHNTQVAKRSTRQEFLKEYKEDPVKFEYDANKFALLQLGLINNDNNNNNMQKEEKLKNSEQLKPKGIMPAITFKRDGDSYYTKERTNYRSYRIPKPTNKELVKTRNIVQSMIRALRSDLSFGNGVRDMDEQFKDYPSIYTEEIRDMAIALRDNNINSHKKHSLKEWESIYENTIELESKLDTTLNTLVSSLGLEPIIKSDSVEGYEFGFSAQFVTDDNTLAKQEVDIITPNEAFRDNVNKKIECKE